MGLLGDLIKGAGGAILTVAAAPVVVGGAVAGVGGAVAGVVSGVIASKAIDTCEKVDKTMEEMKNIPKKNV